MAATPLELADKRGGILLRLYPGRRSLRSLAPGYYISPPTGLGWAGREVARRRRGWRTRGATYVVAYKGVKTGEDEDEEDEEEEAGFGGAKSPVKKYIYLFDRAGNGVYNFCVIPQWRGRGWLRVEG
jgi:hypothetical protein